MTLNWNAKGIHRRQSARLILGVTLLFTGMAQGARAQEAEQPKPCTAKTPLPESTVTVYLKHVTQVQEANDLQTAVRNMVSRAKVYYNQSANAVLLRGSADDLATAQKVIADLDLPKKAYRLKYAVEMVDGTKPASTQHYVLIVTPGERGTLKLGNRVPLVTGKTDGDNATASSQVQYVDVGLSISATLSGGGDGLMLRTKLEESSLADEKSGMGAQDPLLHQAVLENASTITLGKALTLGSLDIPGGTQRVEVEVVSELVK
jgi:type II secretory pathway component GspD/PulD (secretin)